MDRRSHARQPIEARARLTVLGGAPNAFDAIVENISGRGMRLRCDRPVPLDTAVRVDFEDCLALGEVCYCQQSDRTFALGIQIEQGLSHVSSIEALMKRITAEDRSAPSRAAR